MSETPVPEVADARGGGIEAKEAAGHEAATFGPASEAKSALACGRRRTAPSSCVRRVGLAHAMAGAMVESSSQGLALVSVLWVTGLLAVLAAGFVSSTRTQSLLARNQVASAKAEALADAGVYRAVVGLLDSDPETGWRADGGPYRFELGDGSVRVTIEDEEGKIDLNAAPLELIAGLFRAIGLSAAQAQLQGDRLGDFRDEDAQPEPLGAEDPEYAAADVEHGAKDAPLIDRSELLQVLGLDANIYDLVRPCVTVHSRSPGIDPRHASSTVLAAVPGMTSGLIEVFTASEPDRDPFAFIEGVETLATVEPYLLRSRDAVYTVRSEGRSAAGGVFVREAVIELGAGTDRPFRIRAWSRRRAPLLR